MGKKKEKSGIGRTLIKDRFKGKRHLTDTHLHTTELNDGYDWNRLNLQSVTEQNTLEEFLATAELAGTEFEAEKLNVKFISEKHSGLLSAEEEQKVLQTQKDHKYLLSVPRRPFWDESTTAAELEKREREDFLQWRRKLAQLSEIEGLILTPFERNLDFWRQLWRVIERSDIVVQIVDSRNPLMFRCEDLEHYVKQIDENKVNLILINKADFLNDQQRNYWAEYFDSINIRVCFWSAVKETERNQEKDLNPDSTNEDDDEEICDTEVTSTCNDSSEMNIGDHPHSSSEKDIDTAYNKVPVPQDDVCEYICIEGEQVKPLAGKGDQQLPKTFDKYCSDNISCDRTMLNIEGDELRIKNSSKVLTGEELLDFISTLHTGQKYLQDVTTIGLVGYPNVGKSSTINALLQTKKVPVSSTPGRTKHFQTLYLDKQSMLCDCPGLVFPTFVSTKAEMVISGILPIDQMRDFVPPVSLVCKHIPRDVLEVTYGFLLPKPNIDEGEEACRLPTAHEVLTAYACMRGFMTHKGVPDFQRSARLILKDYVNGKLLFCHPPPTVTSIDFKTFGDPVKCVKQNKLSSTVKEHNTSYQSTVDQEFFEKVNVRTGSKGVHGVVGYARKDGFTAHYSDTNQFDSNSQGSQASLAGKPWKKHGNKNKKEKLRRKHKGMDLHTNQL